MWVECVLCSGFCFHVCPCTIWRRSPSLIPRLSMFVPRIHPLAKQARSILFMRTSSSSAIANRHLGQTEGAAKQKISSSRTRVFARSPSDTKSIRQHPCSMALSSGRRLRTGKKVYMKLYTRNFVGWLGGSRNIISSDALQKNDLTLFQNNRRFFTS